MDLNTLFADNQWIFFAGRAAMLAVALLAFAFAFGSWRRAGARDLQRIMAETHELASLTQRLAQQLAQMEVRLEDRRHLAEASTAPAAQRGYDLALQMARNGASPEELVNASGVTRHEAQLLARLHNPART
jgi:hypothetical protein